MTGQREEEQVHVRCVECCDLKSAGRKLKAGLGVIWEMGESQYRMDLNAHCRFFSLSDFFLKIRIKTRHWALFYLKQWVLKRCLVS